MESLKPTLGPRDQVIVVNEGLGGLNQEERARYPWITILDNRHRGPAAAAALNEAAQLANGEFLIFLSDDCIVFEGWLEELLAPFADNTIGAVGPRSNGASGEQWLLGFTADRKWSGSIEESSQAWRRAHLGQTTESSRLDGLCLAVPARLFHSVGGFDEDYSIARFRDDDLSMKFRTAGRKLLIAHGCYVHCYPSLKSQDNVLSHDEERRNKERFQEQWNADAVTPLILLSVCMIVKNEESVLKSCLDSVSGVADEVVVYDTGSTDGTVEIARSFGARVIEGYWDDSFARARNAALEHATGEWVLSLDADESLLADPALFRSQLADRRSNLEAYLLAIENIYGAGRSRSVHTAIRLFRRQQCAWRHRLHEQVVAADDPDRPLEAGYFSGVRIIHHGYSAEVFSSRNKAERNLALAKAALDDGELSRPYALMNYGRALETAGRSEEAVDALVEAAKASDMPSTQRLARSNLIYVLAHLGRFEEALEQVGELRRISISQIAADIAEGRTRIAMGDTEDGLALLARVPLLGRDDDGMEYAAHMLAAVRGEALASLGRYGEAADVVLEAVRRDGVLEADLAELCFWLIKAGRSLSEIAQATSLDDLMPVLGRVVRLPHVFADAILEAIWTRFPNRLEPLAAAGRLAPNLPVARALVWSSRLRNVGLASACPLVAIAKDEQREPRLRILAAAAAYGSFADRSVVNAVHEARSMLDPQALVESTNEISRIAPGLLEASHEEPIPVGENRSSSPSAILERKSQVRRMNLLKVSSLVHRHGINIVGPFESTTVEGYIARALANSLSSHGLSVSTSSYYSDGRTGPVQWTHRDEGDLPYDTTLIVLTPEDIGDFVMDNGSAPFEGRYNIGVWPWDFDQPSKAMSVASLALHEVWVPSRFAESAVASITHRAVIRMPIPVTTYWPVDKSCKIDESSNFTFTFLAGVDYITGFERQNPLGIVKAFTTAFRPGAGPGLVIEACHADRHISEHKTLLEAVAGRSDIIVVDNYGRSSGRVFGKIGTRACFVSLHRSEGTGLMIARSMARSIPTIVTAQGFSREFQSPQDSFQIPFSPVPIPEDELRCLPGGKWAEPDLDKAAKAMRMVVERPKVASSKVQQAKERARQMSPGKVAKGTKERLAAIDLKRYGNQRDLRVGRARARG